MQNTDTNIINLSDSKQLLSDNWTMFKSTPDEYQSPADFEFSKLQTKTTSVPCTVASSLDLPEPECWTPSINYDDYDWWYQTDFQLTNIKNQRLIFEGLATIAEIWINDKTVLTSDNMFISHIVDLDEISIPLKLINTLTICFRSLNHELTQKRPRPKWKTKLVSSQSLRYFRTTLLGRIPGWTPPVPAVGPWRPIYIHDKSIPYNVKINTRLQDTSGIINFSCELNSTDSIAESYLSIGESRFIVEIKKIERADNVSFLECECEIENVDLWWPHTHGKPILYQPILTIISNDITTQYTLNKIGFKLIELDRSNDNFRISINNQSIFCRGACWTTNDIVSLSGDNQELRKTLVLMHDAGANMIRIGGTMVYESDLFYQICDELGIMVWQDFMFANMDYPFEDESFLSSVLLEVNQQIKRLKQHACLTLFCGNSEIQQQVAMLGFDKNVWEIDFYEETLAKICQELVPDHPYVSSSPTGGDLPFRSNQGLSHYYGVGAYLCPISELRNHDVKFTSECLGFSNIPETKTRNKVLKGQIPVTHNPIWKQRAPRDTGTGWDFEDIRDHYLKSLFSIEPVVLRSLDPERYMQLSEFVTGEIMAQAFSEWRSETSNCNGALVWFAKDLWPGAGWGIIDSLGNPKACYYSLRRAWKKTSITITDESINGLELHFCNELDNDFSGTVELKLFNDENVCIEQVRSDVNIPKKTIQSISTDKLIARFLDVSNAYRFGPAKYEYCVAELISNKGQLIDDAFHFPKASLPTYTSANNIDLNIVPKSKGCFSLELKSRTFIHCVNIKTSGFRAEDNFFHLPPNSKRVIELTPISLEIKQLKGSLSALNLKQQIRL